METAVKEIQFDLSEQEEARLVNEANDIIASFIESHKHLYSDRAWHEYGTFSEVEEALRLHRLRKKFSIVDREKSAERREATISKFLQGNSRARLSRSAAHWHRLSLHPSMSWLARARRLVHDLFAETCVQTESHTSRYDLRDESGSKPSIVDSRKVHVHALSWDKQIKLLLTPGEQFISTSGDVSAVAKIHHHTWTVTRKAEPLAKKVVRRSRAWRRVIMQDGLRRAKELGATRGGLSLDQWKDLIFELGWRNRVQLVRGSRLTTVPKNNETDRLINVEPLLNVGLQQWLGQLLANRLKKAGIDIDLNQSLHKKLCFNLEFATIDFSAASDSYGIGLIEYLFPSWFVSALKRVRSSVFEYEHQGSKILEPLNVYACMGNGTTFAVLTAIVWAVGYAVSGSTTYAYGDDLIVKREKTKAVIHAFETLGFTVNTDKSFFEGPVRESCGAFVYDKQALRSYDIKSVECLHHIVVTANKLRRYIAWSGGADYWLQLWAQLVLLVPSGLQGPISDWDNPKEVVPWLEVEGYGNTVRSGLLDWFHQHTGIDAVICNGLEFNQASLPCDVRDFDLALLRIEQGTRPIRHRRGDGEWKIRKFVVACDGRLIGSVTDLRRQRSEYIKRFRTWFVGPLVPSPRDARS